MEGVLKRKATVKFNYNQIDFSTNGTHSNLPRPPSPYKSQPSSSPTSIVSVRPKAKVNSTATPSRKAINAAASSVKSSASPIRTTPSGASTPRAVSPFKINPQASARRMPSKAPSPTSQPKVRATVRTVRPHTAHSELEVPEPRRRSITNIASDAGPLNRARTRHGSISLHHSSSFAAFHHSQPSSRSASPVAIRANSPSARTDIGSLKSGPTKVKAKVSSLAKQFNEQPVPTAPPSLHSLSLRSHAPSISNNSLQSPPSSSSSTFYPITTASPAANPHRFDPPRPSPPPVHTQFQPFRTKDEPVPPLNPIGLGIIAKVDPTLVPLPPISPPASALSFSSRSSVSKSSVSYSTESAVSPTTHPNGISGSPSLLNSPIHDLALYSTNPDGSLAGRNGDDDSSYPHDHHVRVNAKTNRKIEDLEITNRSLLAINSSLESTKHRQAKEIRELRRKLRESRLILPPRAYRAVQSSFSSGEQVDSEDGDDDDMDSEDVDSKDDAVYDRVKSLIEGLLESGRRALESKPESFPASGKTVAKVLSPDEQQTWRDAADDLSDHDIRLVDDHSDGELSNIAETQTQDSFIISPSSDSAEQNHPDYTSEDEVEAMALPSVSPSPSLPPIFVTESS